MMSNQAFVAKLKGLGIRVTLNDGKLKVSGPKENITNEVRAELVARKDDLVSFLQQLHGNDNSGQSDPLPLVSCPKDAQVPLTCAQRRMWFLEKMDSNNAAYNMPAVMQLKGTFDVAAARRAFDCLIDRHESLRTCFVEQDGKPYQHIADAAAFELNYDDWSADSDDSARQQRLNQRLSAFAKAPFDLAAGPLLKGLVVRLGKQEHVLMLNLHHIISDAWSMGVLIKEFQQLYSGFCQGQGQGQSQSPMLAPMAMQLKDFAYSELQWQSGRPFEQDLSYWQQQLADAPTAIELPFDRARSGKQSYSGAGHRFKLAQADVAALRRLCAAQGATLYMGLVAVFAELLSRYSQSDDLVIGTTVANRRHRETEGLLAPLINSVPLRLQRKNQGSFVDLLAQAKAVVVAAQEHATLPFDLLVEKLNVERQVGLSPVFQVMFSLQNQFADELHLPGLEASLIANEITTSRLELTLSMLEKGDDITAVFEYSTALFEAVTIETLAERFSRLLSKVLAAPEKPLAQQHFFTFEQWQWLTSGQCGADPQAADHTNPMVAGHTLVSLFDKAARRRDALALKAAGETLCYGELDEAANRLAHYLITQGLTTGQPVGVCLNRSASLIVALLAVVKAGGCYVPVDPNYPPSHQAHLIEDSGMSLMLSDLDSHFGDKVTVVNPEAGGPLSAELAQLPGKSPEVEVVPEQPVYIIYTSGSTGKPKGVVVSHANLMNLIGWHCRAFEVSANDRATFMAGVAFDASAWEIWPYLAAGAALVAVDRDTLLAPEKLVKLLVDEQVAIAFAPTPIAHHLLKAKWPEQMPLRYLLTGGDKLARYPDASLPFTLVNNYGPTENTVVATSIKLSADDGYGQPAIGWAIDNVETYILDPERQPVAPGIAGELYLGGASLATGYFNRPDLTAERFVEHPFAKDSGKRLYRTGDKVRLRANGQIEFIERVDNQVKIRGMRVELGEIEAILSNHSSVKDVLVLVGDERLAAFVSVPNCADEDTMAAELQAYAKARLPQHMVPEQLLIFAELPLTANGKVDRKQLLSELQQRVAQEASGNKRIVEPTTETEKRLVALWCELLKVPVLGIHDNFFDCGGHSMLIMQVIANVKAMFDLELAADYLFERSTVFELARDIDAALAQNDAKVALSVEEIDLAAEVVLPDSLAHLSSLTKAEVGPSSTVMLTGATGFLGAFLLAELLQAGEHRVACLVRAADKAQGLARIQATLEKYHLWQGHYLANIEAVIGDLSLPRLGLCDADWQQLCEQVDAIYHNGAQVNFLFNYRALKKANVGSTLSIIDLATTGKLKTVHYVSTLSVFSPLDHANGPCAEAMIPSGKQLQGGYAQSKWVAEQLLYRAHDLGLPVTIYRPGRITGDSVNGIANTDDFFYQVLQGCFELSIDSYPEDVYMDMTPVDYVSRSIVYLAALKPEVDSHKPEVDSHNGPTVYHLCNPKCSDSALFDTISERGHTMRPCDYGQWQAQLKSRLADLPQDRLGAFNVVLKTNPDDLNKRDRSRAPFDCRATVSALGRSADKAPVSCPPVDGVLCSLYLDYLVDCGFIPRLPGGQNIAEARG